MGDLQREITKLRRILGVTRELAVTNDLDALLRRIVDATCEVLECERATLFLYDPETDELYSRVAKGMSELRISADRGIAGTAARHRTCVNVPDAYADERFNPEVDRQTGFRTRNLLTLPLENLDGALMGVLQALNKRSGPFDKDDESLAEALAAQAGAALDRGRLIEEYAEKQRMTRDLDIARSIQQQQFPEKDPVVPGYEIAGWNRSADETGGDCYDFVALPDGRLAIILADATGHGIGAALVIAQCRAALRAMFLVTRDLATIATRVNEMLCGDLADDRFVTAFVGILDPRANVIDYISGGQGPLIFVDRGVAERRRANALPFAVTSDCEMGPVERFEFTPGSTLVLMTDGFYESVSAAGEQFGDDRVIEHIAACADKPLVELIDRLHQAVREFTDGGPQADDLTAVLVRRTL